MIGGRFTIDPDPPVAGQPATITYTGNEKEVIWVAWGEDRPRKVSVPPKTIPINSVPSGEALAISDGSGQPEGDAEWPIDDPRRASRR